MICEISCVEPTLDALDDASADTLIVRTATDERPLRGVVGLLDWRLNGKLTSMCRGKTLTGQSAERLLLPLRPAFDIHRLVLLGVGQTETMQGNGALAMLRDMMRTMTLLKARQAWIEIPLMGDDLNLLGSMMDDVLLTLVHDPPRALERLVFLAPTWMHRVMMQAVARKLGAKR